MDQPAGIPLLLSFFAALECLLAIALILRIFHIPLWPRRWMRRDAERLQPHSWIVIALERAVAASALFAFVVAHARNLSHFEGGSDTWGGFAAMALAVAAGLEIHAAYAAAHAWRRDGNARALGIHLFISIGVMCALSFCALYQVPYALEAPFHRALGLAWDPLYVLPATLVCVTFMAFMLNVIPPRWNRRRGIANVLCVALAMLLLWKAWVPLQARYLAAYAPSMPQPYLHQERPSPGYVRFMALKSLVPYLVDYAPLDNLPPALWHGVTSGIPPSDDPVYRAQLLRAAKGGFGLDRLWLVDLEEARWCSARRLRLELAGMRIWQYDDASVLFLYEPNHLLFRELIPDAAKRDATHRLLVAWNNRFTTLYTHRVDTKNEPSQWLEDHPRHEGWRWLKRTFQDLDYDLWKCHVPGVWLELEGQLVPYDLMVPVTRLCTFNNPDVMFQWLACPHKEVAMEALDQIIDYSRRTGNNRLVKGYPNDLNLSYALYALHPDHLVTFLQRVAIEYGEAETLREIESMTFPWEGSSINRAQIITHWHQIALTAPRFVVQDSSQIDAETSNYLNNRLQFLETKATEPNPLSDVPTTENPSAETLVNAP